jgi:hypothetical protein
MFGMAIHILTSFKYVVVHLVMDMNVVAFELHTLKPNIEGLSSLVDMGNIEIQCPPETALIIVGEDLQELGQLLGCVELCEVIILVQLIRESNQTL